MGEALWLPVLGPLGAEMAQWHRPKAEEASALQALDAKWGKMPHRCFHRGRGPLRGALLAQRAQNLWSGESSGPLGNEHRGRCLADGKLSARLRLKVITSLILHSGGWGRGTQGGHQPLLF